MKLKFSLVLGKNLIILSTLPWVNSYTLVPLHSWTYCSLTFINLVLIVLHLCYYWTIHKKNKKLRSTDNGKFNKYWSCFSASRSSGIYLFVLLHIWYMSWIQSLNNVSQNKLDYIIKRNGAIKFNNVSKCGFLVL